LIEMDLGVFISNRRHHGVKKNNREDLFMRNLI